MALQGKWMSEFLVTIPIGQGGVFSRTRVCHTDVISKTKQFYFAVDDVILVTL